MTFKVGETVVYPHHGAARIIKIQDRKVRGETRVYLTLEVAQGDLTIMVPAENVEEIGVRDVVDQDGLEHVFEVLRTEQVEEPTNWSRRYKANQETIASGAVEKRMLAKARQILVSELALAQKVEETAAEQILDEVLAD